MFVIKLLLQDTEKLDRPWAPIRYPEVLGLALDRGLNQIRYRYNPIETLK